ncbi:MAG TPA: hypothetical protein VIJ21_11445 [Solirubrobacterales bacterium]
MSIEKAGIPAGALTGSGFAESVASAGGPVMVDVDLTEIGAETGRISFTDKLDDPVHVHAFTGRIGCDAGRGLYACGEVREAARA